MTLIDNFPTTLAVDSSGVYIGGVVRGVLPGQTRAGLEDAFLRKYDLSGNVMWTQQLGSGFTDSAASGMAIDSTGIYVVGYTQGALPGQSSSGGFDTFIRKYDADGNELWTRQSGVVGDDQAFGVAADWTGVYVAGIGRGQVNLSAYLRKYDADGNLLWVRQFAYPPFSGAKGIALDATGVYVLGAAAGALPGQPSSAGTDTSIRKYDSDGTELWTRQFGSGMNTAGRLTRVVVQALQSELQRYRQRAPPYFKLSFLALLALFPQNGSIPFELQNLSRLTS